MQLHADISLPQARKNLGMKFFLYYQLITNKWQDEITFGGTKVI